MGGSIPKPFLPFGAENEPVIYHTVRALSAYSNCSGMVLILAPDLRDELWREHGEALTRLGVTAVASGGASRQESVANGLATLTEECDLVAVHDAVRPFPSKFLLQNLMRAAQHYGGALPVLQVTDTVKRVDESIASESAAQECSVDGVVHETVPRAGLYSVQTPQVFRADLFREAYSRAASLGEEVTDDAMVVEQAGGTVVGVRGERFNLKLTTPEDMPLAAALLAAGLVGGSDE
jgi:2-C-methyl-D-erythritol 4-phosphate cytidylyltransferase